MLQPSNLLPLLLRTIYRCAGCTALPDMLLSQCFGQNQDKSAQGAEDCDRDELCSDEPDPQPLAGKPLLL